MNTKFKCSYLSQFWFDYYDQERVGKVIELSFQWRLFYENRLNTDGVISIPARCQIGLYFNFDCLYLSCFSSDFKKKKWFRKHKILSFQQGVNDRSVMKIFMFFPKKIWKNDDWTHKISCIAIVFFLIDCLFVGWKRTINSAFNALRNMKIGRGIPEYWMKVCFYTMGSRTRTPWIWN